MPPLTPPAGPEHLSMRATWGREVTASLVVFLVAVPLSLGIAVASGAPVQAGLIAAVVGGIVVGLFGGAPLQVSGPAAGLTVMVAGFAHQYGLRALSVIVILAGLMQMAMGLGKVAKAALVISPAVLHAMLAGIGILLALGQFHVMLGSKPHGSAWLNLTALPDSFEHINPSAVIVAVVTLMVLIGWNRFVAPRFKAIPGSLMGILVGTGVSYLVPHEVAHVTLGASLVSGFALPTLDGQSLSDLAQSAIALTVVASAESLLCAVATDQLHRGERANLDKELFGQGLANMLSGLLGGLPVTGVIVRSSANIAAGAQTRWSAVLHGVWVAAFVLLGAKLLGRLPLAALAALLVYVGINLIKVKELRRIAAFNEALICGVTLVGVVFINLLWGIAIGFGLALLTLLQRLAVTRLAVTTDPTGELHVVLSGALSFLSVPSLMGALRDLPTGKTVHLAFQVDHIDHAAIEAIHAWRRSYESSGGRVVTSALDSVWRELAGKAP